MMTDQGFVDVPCRRCGRPAPVAPQHHAAEMDEDCACCPEPICAPCFARLYAHLMPLGDKA